MTPLRRQTPPPPRLQRSRTHHADHVAAAEVPAQLVRPSSGRWRPPCAPDSRSGRLRSNVATRSRGAGQRPLLRRATTSASCRSGSHSGSSRSGSRSPSRAGAQRHRTQAAPRTIAAARDAAACCGAIRWCRVVDVPQKWLARRRDVAHSNAALHALLHLAAASRTPRRVATAAAPRASGTCALSMRRCHRLHRQRRPRQAAPFPQVGRRVLPFGSRSRTAATPTHLAPRRCRSPWPFVGRWRKPSANLMNLAGYAKSMQ